MLEPGSFVANFYEKLTRTTEGPPNIQEFKYTGSLLDNFDLYIDHFYPALRGQKAAHCDGYITTSKELLDDIDFPCNQRAEEFFKSHEKVGYVSQLFTLEPYRRRGWGGMLLREWMRRIQRHGVTGVYLNVAETPWLTGFYSRYGFTMLDDGTLHDTSPMMGAPL